MIEAKMVELVECVGSLEAARNKIMNCPGYVRSECLTCDEAGACVVELISALAMFEDSSDEREGADAA